jgi:D-tyrosyl-tRNA(Tyr) deacylase
MRIVIQRVSRASVQIEDGPSEAIGPGLVVLVAISRNDSEKDAEFLVGKLAALRIFPDQQGKMNLNLLETGGELLIVSNFTLYGDCRKGRRPSFDRAATPERALPLYDYFLTCARKICPVVKTGVFQAHMSVQIDNSGPVTLICDSSSTGDQMP